MNKGWLVLDALLDVFLYLTIGTWVTMSYWDFFKDTFEWLRSVFSF